MLLACVPISSIAAIVELQELAAKKPIQCNLASTELETRVGEASAKGRVQNGLVFDPPRSALHLNANESRRPNTVLLVILLKLIPAALTRVLAARFERIGFCYVGFAVAFECNAHFPHLKQTTLIYNAIVELTGLHSGIGRLVHSFEMRFKKKTSFVVATQPVIDKGQGTH